MIDMNYPDILRKEGDPGSLQLSLDIAPNLDAFAGHFEEFPIVPGVVQIQWALHFFKRLMAVSPTLQQATVAKMSALKFQHVITPNTEVILSLNFDDDKSCLAFKMSNAEHNFSSGKLFLRQSPSNHD